MTEPRGSIYVELDVNGRWAVSLLTKDWSAEEKAALLAGEEDAREALRDAAMRATMDSPDDVDLRFAEVDVNGERTVQRG